MCEVNNIIHILYCNDFVAQNPYVSLQEVNKTFSTGVNE